MANEVTAVGDEYPEYQSGEFVEEEGVYKM